MKRASLAYVILAMSSASYGIYASPYYQSLGIPVGAIGLLLAMTSSVSLICAPLWGTLNDRLPGSRLLLPAAAGFAALGALGISSVGATWLLIPVAATFALGGAGMAPMMDVRILEMVGADRTRYARVRVWASVSFIIATPLVGLLIDRDGLHALFWVMIPALLGTGLAASTLPGRKVTVRAPSMTRAVGTVLRHRPIALFLIGATVAWTAISAQNSFISIYLLQLGASSDQVGWAWSVAAMTEVPTMFFFPALARRFGVERLIVLGVLVLLVRQSANVIFTAPSVLIAMSLVQGVGFSLLLIGGVTFVSRHAPKGTAATALGILSAVSLSLASILGSGLGGQVAGLIGLRGLYACAVGLSLIAAVLIGVAVLPVARARAAEAASSAPPPRA